MAVAQLLLSMEPKYICHKLCTMGTSSPMVPILSTEIFPIPAITESYGEFPLNSQRALKSGAGRNLKTDFFKQSDKTDD